MTITYIIVQTELKRHERFETFIADRTLNFAPVSIVYNWYALCLCFGFLKNGVFPMTTVLIEYYIALIGRTFYSSPYLCGAKQGITYYIRAAINAAEGISPSIKDIFP